VCQKEKKKKKEEKEKKKKQKKVSYTPVLRGWAAPTSKQAGKEWTQADLAKEDLPRRGWWIRHGWGYLVGPSLKLMAPFLRDTDMLAGTPTLLFFGILKVFPYKWRKNLFMQQRMIAPVGRWQAGLAATDVGNQWQKRIGVYTPSSWRGCQ
jgi:hypothetical protein